LYTQNEIIERVTQFTYLGSIIGDTGGTEADTYYGPDSIQCTEQDLALNGYSTQTKLRSFNTNVKTVPL
jgi:hypothetical protein